ncbi:MAG TPA: hypothetical protein ENI52_02610 [Thermoplasmata archaeon]|nr:hypothetical protein [Thermoplasmata archaeon]
MKNIQIRNIDERLYFKIRELMASLHCRSYEEFLWAAVDYIEKSQQKTVELDKNRRIKAVKNLYGIIPTDLPPEKIREIAEEYLVR